MENTNTDPITSYSNLLAALKAMVRVWPDGRCICADEPEGTICHYCESKNDALLNAVAIINQNAQPAI